MELTLLSTLLLLKAVLFFASIALVVMIAPNHKNIDPPFLPSRHTAIRRALDMLAIKPHDVVYELGCGSGRFLFAAYEREPHARYVGIEHSLILIMYARARRLLLGNPRNIEFIRGNLFDTPLAEATKVYAYLLRSAMVTLLPKASRELKGATLVSLAFAFPAEKKCRDTVTIFPPPSNHGEHLLYIYDF